MVFSPPQRCGQLSARGGVAPFVKLVPLAEKKSNYSAVNIQGDSRGWKCTTCLLQDHFLLGFTGIHLSPQRTWLDGVWGIEGNAMDPTPKQAQSFKPEAALNPQGSASLEILPPGLGFASGGSAGAPGHHPHVGTDTTEPQVCEVMGFGADGRFNEAR